MTTPYATEHNHILFPNTSALYHFTGICNCECIQAVSDRDGRILSFDSTR